MYHEFDESRSLALPVDLPWTATDRIGLAKRGLDGLLVALTAPVALPLVGLAALLLVLLGRSPFYVHTRIGRSGRPFRCYKLRTMRTWSAARFAAYLAARPEAAQEFAWSGKLARDPRIGLLGRFLRVTSIDELPQLWNVARGEMSIVGPRPITRAELARYSPLQRDAYTRVRPGLTGLWQVRGRNRLSMGQRAELDAEYVANFSIGQDIAILFRTIPVVLRCTGI